MDIRLIFLNWQYVVSSRLIKGQPLSGLWCLLQGRRVLEPEVTGGRAEKNLVM
jgi:hypothetical protein